MRCESAMWGIIPAAGNGTRIQPLAFSKELLPVEQPELFDAGLMDEACRVREIQVKRADAASRWVWGAFKMPGAILHELNRLWISRNRSDEYIGTLVNAWLAAGGQALGVRAGEPYIDVGTLPGFRRAVAMLSKPDDGEISEWSGERADIR